MKEITENVVKSGFNGIFVIASNPVDLMSYVVQKVSGFPKNKVIGSGTVLDTARLRYLIGERLNVSSKNIHAYIMGEHGDSSFVPWTHSYVGCKKLLDILKERGENENILSDIYTEVQQSAYEIIEKKRATYYGIGMGLAKLVRTILNNGKEILTVSTKLEGEYGHEGIYIGVPAIIGNNGVQELLNLPLTAEEQKQFDNSCDVLMGMKKEIDNIIG